MEVMYGGYGGDDGGSQVSVGPSACISTVYIYKNAMQNYFCETMKYEKMNDDRFFFIFLRLHSKYFLRGFYAP